MAPRIYLRAASLGIAQCRHCEGVILGEAGDLGPQAYLSASYCDIEAPDSSQAQPKKMKRNIEDFLNTNTMRTGSRQG
jgi:hypothetical protein